jgi:formate/nitrite transporter FocA (FNT family)
MFYLVAIKYVSWKVYAVDFFAPTLLGNIIGGVSLVAALGHAQVVGGREN